ncbi:MAG: hypothetical protein PSV16_06760 [Flavobacterium sp.]|nr:hypothetical protein [Flavobacterium sp.]
MERENWTNEIINSTDGMQKAIPTDILFLKIQNEIRIRKSVPAKWLWAAAASFLLLLALNFSMLNKRQEKTENPTEMIAVSISRTNQLY